MFSPPPPRHSIIITCSGRIIGLGTKRLGLPDMIVDTEYERKYVKHVGMVLENQKLLDVEKDGRRG